MSSIVDITRTLMRIRTDRARQDPGPAPRRGAFIHFNGYRMRVTAPPSTELWNWLTLAGWRECAFRNDRRKYNDLPEYSFDVLAGRSSASREDAYHKLIRQARG